MAPRPAVGYGMAAFVPCLAAGLLLLWEPAQPYGSGSIFLAGIGLVAWFAGFRPALLATLLSVAALELPAAPARGTAVRDALGALAFTALAVLLAGFVASRRRLQAALARGEARLARIVDSALDAIVCVDADHGVVLFNRAAEAMFGCAAAAAAGRSVERFFSERAREPLRSRLRTPGDPAPAALIGVRAGGEEFAVEAAVSRAEVAGERLVTLVLRDVSERRRREQALRDSEERHRLACLAAGGWIWDWDMTTGQCVGGDDVGAPFGYDAEAMRGPIERVYAWWEQRLHPGDREGVRAALEQALSGPGSGFQAEYRFRCADGSYTHVLDRAHIVRDAAGRAVRMIGVMADVGERKRVEEDRARLLTREREARAAVEAVQRRTAFLSRAGAALASSLDYERTLRQLARLAVPEIADGCAVDLVEDDGTIRRVEVVHSDPAREAIGWELWRRYPSWPGAPLERVVHGGRAELVPEVTEEYLATIARDADHLRLLRAAGLRSLMLVPLLARGRALGALCLVIADSSRRYDASDLAFAEELALRAGQAIENARLYRQSEAGSKAKDDFLAMLGHELRNPLAAIRTSVQMLGEAGSRERTVRTREIIVRQVAHVASLVDDLLDVARVSAGKISLERKALDLAAAVRQCLATLQGTGQGSGRAIAADLEPVWVKADPTRVEQIATNLIENALKYTPGDGAIRIQTRAEAGDAVFRVEDEGVGISAELLPRIFDLFAQGEPAPQRSRGGLGVGLTLVRSLVELHGGSVAAASAGAGRGSTFTVRLPRIAAPLAREDAPPRPRLRVNPQRILVVEDNDDVREALLSYLELAGHEVHQAHDGPEALEAAVRLKPDVALVDVGLPGFDGYELARRVRASPEARRTRLIAVTGYGMPDDRRRAAEAGFDEYLVKPFDPDRLSSVLAR